MQRRRHDSLVGPWPEFPWVLLGLAALAAPVAVLAQGGTLCTGLLASCVVLGSPGAAIEAMLGAARLTTAMERD
jgi:hypothetical protein